MYNYKLLTKLILILSLQFLTLFCSSKTMVLQDQKGLPENIFEEPFVEPTSLEKKGIKFNSELLVTSGEYKILTEADGNIYMEKLSANTQTSGKMVNTDWNSRLTYTENHPYYQPDEKFSGRVSFYPFYFFRSPEFAMKLLNTINKLNKIDYFTNKNSGVSYMPKMTGVIGLMTNYNDNYGEFQDGFTDGNIRKIGDKWSSISRFCNSIGGIGRGHSQYYGLIDNYEFKGVVIKNGNRYAIISVSQVVYSFHMYAEENKWGSFEMGSNVYVNEGNYSVAYNYAQKKIEEILYDGKFNIFTNGAIHNPLKYFDNTEIKESMSNAITTIKTSGLFMLGGGAGGILGGLVGLYSGQKAKESAIKAVKLHYDLDGNTIQKIANIAFQSKVYPDKLNPPVRYKSLMRFIEKK